MADKEKPVLKFLRKNERELIITEILDKKLISDLPAMVEFLSERTGEPAEEVKKDLSEFLGEEVRKIVAGGC